MLRYFLVVGAAVAVTRLTAAEPVDFNRDVRPILSNICYACHGPDDKVRKGDLRLDTREGATANGAVAPGKPEASELVKRILSADAAVVMPPPKTGKKLTPKEIETLTNWVKQGAPYAGHWSYIKPARPAAPDVKHKSWAKKGIDPFILAKLEALGLKPQPEADRHTLVRRLALDLTGLPPTPEEVETFVADKSPNAYEKLVDRLLAKPAFGEHWARLWLDLARYADSAGYADDPARTIWAYRDYVIKSFNANKPFDRFTVEQLAGDLLPNPTDEQLTATAFHRNTLTNSEGGTNDEEFRNVAVVDRVNTTMAVWMGTSMACAQCHTHKFDPITQKEYFAFFAFLNNTEDADRGDETPLLSLFTDDQRKQKATWEAELLAVQARLKTPASKVLEGLPAWEAKFPRSIVWTSPKPSSAKSRSKSAAEIAADGTITAGKRGVKQDVDTLEVPLTAGKLAAIRIESSGAFSPAGVIAKLVSTESPAPKGRYVRIELPGQDRILSLAEVQVFAGADNVALKGIAKQSTTGFEGEAKRAIDGKTDGEYYRSNSVTHSGINDPSPWWEVDLKATTAVDRIGIWNRTDGGATTIARLGNFRLVLLDEARQTVWEQTVKEAPNPSKVFELGGGRNVPFTAAFANYPSTGHDPAGTVIHPAGKAGKRTLTLTTPTPIDVPSGSKLVLTIGQYGPAEATTPSTYRVSVSDDPKAKEFAGTPETILDVLKAEPAKRTPAEAKALADYYLTIAPELKADRDSLTAVQKSLADLKPATTVPIYRELPPDRKRVTKVQVRGNYQDVGDVVTEGVPAAFPPLPKGAALNRLTLANWLVSKENPLTPRVMANRFWEQIFGIGLVRTSEDFGAQGEQPSHPELLDTLAVEFRDNGWDVKAFLKFLVTSAAYRQSARVTPDVLEKDPDNRFVSRGPRFRLSAEMIRDQALAVAGLLSPKMYGPSAKPPQPSFGLSAAFGRTLDWQTSTGEDRYRRGLYTEWRRTNPYPSMATFDAPSREACTLRRVRTNTPLQALVTLNDPVFIEAAQALARKMAVVKGDAKAKLAFGFTACVSRPPSEKELAVLVKLYDESKAKYAKDPVKAMKMATDPLGPIPAGSDAVDLAAWTVVGNVLLNLDEFVMRR